MASHVIPASPVCGCTPARLKLIENLLILLLFGLYAYQAVPTGSEVNYLGKAKHFWDPSWVTGDLYLESADTHTVFYVLGGWVTRLLSLDASAWVVRVAGWLALAAAWGRLSRAVVPCAWAAPLSAAVYLLLARALKYSGEWVVGTAEAKPFAYALVWWAMAEILDARWGRAFVLLGAATSLHVLVGGWATVAALAVLVFRRHEAGKSAVGVGLCVGAVLAMAGLIPALASTWPADASISRTAAEIQVFHRLRHHLLDPAMVWRGWRLLAYVMAWLIVVYAGRRDARLRKLQGFVAAALAIAVVGVGLEHLARSRPDVAAPLLKYYLFRLSDAMLPVGISLGVVFFLARTGPTRAAAVRLAVVLLALAGIPAIRGAVLGSRLVVPEAFGQPAPGQDRRARFADWRQVSQWARREAPPTARFLTAYADESVLWLFERGEVVNYKNVPQDAAGVVEWADRVRLVYGSIDRPDEDAPIHATGLEHLREIAARYGEFFYVCPADVRFDLPCRYRNQHFAVYLVPDACRL